MRVVIVGAGIGGIVTALALRRHGIESVVLEQAPELREVGAGIQLSPNGVRVLTWLGLEEKLAAVSVEPRAHVFRDFRSGEVLLTLPLRPQVRESFGAPYYHTHRADLLQVLLDAHGGGVRLGRRVTRVWEDEEGVGAELEPGDRVRGDVLVASDGIHSLVRDRLFAPDPPRASGYSAWRGLVPLERVAELFTGDDNFDGGLEPYSSVWLGPGRSMVVYQVAAGRLVNWVGIGASPAAERESWSATGTADAARTEYDGWHRQITGLVAATESLFLTKLYDRDPLPTWARGRIALLGDAAHAMLPYHAQGATQSIEDAWVLAHCLAADADDAPAALARYEGLRRERASQVQGHSRAAQEWYHYSDPRDIARRNERFRHQAERGAESFSSQQAWLYGYDAEKAARGEDAEWRRSRWR